MSRVGSGSIPVRKALGRRVVASLAMMVVYVALDVLLRRADFGHRPMPFYPPAGIAMAGLVIIGAPAALALVLARFVLNWVLPNTTTSIAIALAISIAQGGSYAVAAALVRRKVGTARHEWTRPEAAWLILGLLLAPLGAGSLGVGIAMLAGVTPAGHWVSAMFRFSLGDLIGELIVVPAMLFVAWPSYQVYRRRQVAPAEKNASDTPAILKERPSVGRLERGVYVAAFIASIILAAVQHVLTGRLNSTEANIWLVLALWVAQRAGLRGAALVIAGYGAAAILALLLMVPAANDVAAMQTTLVAISIGALVVGAQRSMGMASDARYWQLLATAREGVWRVDANGRTVHANDRMAEILGRPVSTIIGEPARAFIAPESLEAWVRQRTRRGLGETTMYETLVVRGDGARVPVLVTASPVLSSVTREIVGSVAVVTDLTQLRQAEASDRLARQLVESSFRTSHDAMILLRAADQVILDVNETWSVMTGVGRDVAIGHSFHDLNLWADPSDATRLGAAIAEHGSVRDFEASFHRHRPGAGVATEIAYALLSAHPIAHEGDSFLLVTARDITHDKRAAATARQLSRLEELGRLAGGVAHDFNNLLTVVLAYGETIADDLGHGRSVDREDVEEIRRAGARGRALTQSLLAFARHQPSEPRAVDVNAILRASNGMLRTILGTRVRLVMEDGTNLPAIMADPSQVDQVLLNLAANARDAMPDGGEFRVRTRLVHAAPGEVGTLIGPAALPGDYVILDATDTGIGMTHATQDHIFEPFFTTKPPTEGTGLGLSVIFGIMRQARGSVRVASEPGQGATFSVAWPAALSAPDTPAAAAATPMSGTRVAGRILVVEDDPTVLRIVSRVLTEGGYVIMAAVDGQDALDQLRATRRDGAAMPDLVLSDVLMPGINGHELSKLLFVEWPELPVILMSGHTGLERMDDLPPTVVMPLIAKPFEVGTLLRAAETALRR